MPAEFFDPIANSMTPPTYRYFDGSAWQDSTSGKTLTVTSPIDGSEVGRLQVVTPDEMDDMLAQAKAAHPQWEATPLNERVKIVKLAADWIRQFEAYLSSVLVKEIGKTAADAKSEIVRTADIIDYFASEVQSLHGETLDSDNFPGYDKGRIAIIERVAHGVVLAIAPFNYPVNLAASKIAPALLMGNCVIFKPPTQGGISGVHLTRIFEKAGVPKGVIACATGGGSDVGNYLVSHKGVDMVAFTGSSETGVAIAGQASMKPLLFECGGNNPAIVFPDADMSLTAKEIVKGGFAYSGQRCTAIKYVLGTKAVLDELIPVVQKTVAELVKMGDPRSPETKMVGPVISEELANQIQQWIDESVAAGAKVIVGGKHAKAYIEPTLIVDVTADMPVVVHEVFGPVISFITVQKMEEIVKIVNETKFGLQACVFTRDEGSGIVFAKQLNVGTVQVNGSPQRGPDHFPFLGVKQSGVGVQGVRYSLEAMSRFRPIVLNKPQ